MTDTTNGLSMRAVTQLTGISEHLLRAWERRYQIVDPQRTPGGTRCYSDQDVARLKLVKRALEAGNKIGTLAGLSNAEMRDLADAAAADRPAIGPILGMLGDGDADAIERELGKLFDWLGPVRWAVEVASPLSNEIGLRWHRGDVSIGEEHLATACLSRVIGANMPSIASGDRDPAAKIVFSTPPEEPHAIGIQLAALVAAAQGATVNQLGVETPSEALAEYAARANATQIVVGAVFLRRSALQAFLRSLRQQVPARVAVVAGGAATGGIKLPAGVTPMASLADFADWAARVSKRAPRTARVRRKASSRDR